jgi:hypothetical protein
VIKIITVDVFAACLLVGELYLFDISIPGRFFFRESLSLSRMLNICRG